jgi:hypothetical protein
MSSSTIRARYPTGTISRRSTGVVLRRLSLIVDGVPLAVVAGGEVTMGYRRAVFLDFYAGVPVAEYQTARLWYERLLGGPPSFVATPTEAV